MKKSLLLIIAIMLSVWQAKAQTTTFDLTAKWDTARVLENPHKGWYHHIYDSELAKYPVAEDAHLDNFPGMDHIYIRIPWSALEPLEDQYDWSYIDAQVAKWTTKGYGISFRVTAYDPWVIQYSTPEWVKNKGAQGEFITIQWAPTTYWEPNYNDPIFLQHLENFHVAFAARYANQPYTRYIDVGSLGTWGEGHKTWGDYGSETEATLQLHLDMHKRVYPNNLLYITDDWIYKNITRDHQTYINEKILPFNISIRDDSPLVDWYVDNNADSYSVSHPQFFDTEYLNKPITLEAQHYNFIKNEGNWQGQDGSIRGADILRGAMRVMHATYIGYQWFANEWLSDNPNLAKQLANESGYWYFIENATLPNQANPSSQQSISVRWKNNGVAPAYKQFQLQLKFVGNVTRTITVPNSNNTDWLDGETETESYGVTIPSDLGNGIYYVKARLFDANSNRIVDLGLKNTIRDAEGFFTLGTMSIGTGGTLPPIPASPSAISSTPTSISKVSLTWADNSNDEDGFIVERKTGSGNFIEVTTLPSNTTSYLDQERSSNSTYTYRIAAYNASGNSSYTSQTTATTFSLGSNLVINPSFEADNGYTQTPQGWQSSGIKDAEYLEAGGFAGQYSYRGVHWNDANYSVSTYQTFTGLENGTYILRAWIQSTGGQEVAKMEAYGYGGSTSINIPTSGVWKLITIEDILVSCHI